MPDVHLSDNALQWPGYEPWHYVVHTYDHAYDSRPITLARLAQEVAKAVRQFKQVSTGLRLHKSKRLTIIIQDMTGIQSREPSWSMDLINVEDLFLVELRHVSTGSWQPVLVWNAAR